MEDTEQYFHVVLSGILCKTETVQTFESMDKILQCALLNES